MPSLFPSLSSLLYRLLYLLYFTLSLLSSTNFNLFPSFLATKKWPENPQWIQCPQWIQSWTKLNVEPNSMSTQVLESWRYKDQLHIISIKQDSTLMEVRVSFFFLRFNYTSSLLSKIQLKWGLDYFYDLKKWDDGMDICLLWYNGDRKFSIIIWHTVSSI